MTLNKQISHFHPKISYLADKLKYFAIETYKKYNLALVNSVKSNENSYNIANDIFDFINNYHRKYGEKFDIDSLKSNINEEENDVYNICKNFIDIIFTDGERYVGDENSNKDNIIKEENNEDYEDDDFEKEKEDLGNKLSGINLNDNLEEVGNSDLYEDNETLKEYDKMNYIRCANGTRKLRIKLTNNIIEDLYIFKNK